MWLNVRQHSWPHVPALVDQDWELFLTGDREVTSLLFYFYYVRSFVLSPDLKRHLNAEDGRWAQIQPDPDSYLELGGYLNARDYNTSSNFAMRDDTLYDIGVYIGGGTFVSEEVLLEGSFYPGIYSDFDGSLHSDDFQYYADLLVDWRSREDLFWKFGVSHNGLFDDTEVYPLIGVAYVIDSEWRVDVLLPRSAEISFSPSASTILMANLTLDGNQYEVNSGAVSGSSTAFVQEYRLGVGGIYRFNDSVSTFGRFGWAFAGDYDVSSGNGFFADGELESTLFFTVGVGLDF